MVKLGIFLEQDDQGRDTGRFQVADEEEDIVYDTFDTEEEAEKAKAKLQAEFDMKDELSKSYLAWEAAFMASHGISQEELRRYLANVVM